MNLPNFFSELKRRNVYKVAVTYAIVGWLLIQIATQVFPFLEIPNWVVRLVIALVAIGFPIALVIAWAFEITPEGIRHAEDVESPPGRVSKNRTWIYVVVIGAAVSLGLFFIGRYTARVGSLSAASQAIPEKSIAVLPFMSLSKDEENAFFADGVQDQVLTNLSKVAGLKVISRTSVMQYRNAAARNLREIAQQLGVIHVLEGSVQRAAGKVRVTAQLIDARNDAHEWAENYDRPIDDVFAIQTEIAKKIAEQLQVRISPPEAAAMSQPPTTDLVAQNLYVRARELSTAGPNDPNGKQDLLEAVRLITDALARDPKFFLAYGLLAQLHDNLYWGGFDHTPARLALEEAAIESAARLQPEAGELHLVRALYSYHAHRDYDRARAELEIARKTLPNDPQVYYFTALIDRRQARWNEALRNLDRALDLDPLNFIRLNEAAQTYGGLRRYDESDRLYERAVAIRPDYYFVRSQLATNAFLSRGDVGPLLELVSRDVPDKTEWAKKSAPDLLLCALAKRDRAMAMRAIDAIAPEGFQDTGTNLLLPRAWFAALAARAFNDNTTAQAAFGAARSVIETMAGEQPDYAPASSFLGVIDAALGRKETAIREGRHACELLPPSADALNGPFLIQNLAQIYAWTGEKDLALQELNTAARLPFGISYGELRLFPQWDALRGDPRFEQIIASLAPKEIGSTDK